MQTWVNDGVQLAPLKPTSGADNCVNVGQRRGWGFDLHGRPHQDKLCRLLLPLAVLQIIRSSHRAAGAQVAFEKLNKATFESVSSCFSVEQREGLKGLKASAGSIVGSTVQTQGQPANLHTQGQPVNAGSTCKRRVNLQTQGQPANPGSTLPCSRL